MVSNQKALECIFNIDTRVQNITDVAKHFNPLSVPLGHPVHADIMFFSIVKMCTVMEELLLLNNLCKDDLFLRDIFYCIKPVNDYVLQYEKGWKLVRNHMVAHFQRDKLGNFRPLQSMLDNLNVPRDSGEWSFIYDCFELIRQVLVSKVPNYLEFRNAQVSEFLRKKDDFAKGFKSKDALYIEDFKKEVNKRFLEKGMSII